MTTPSSRSTDLLALAAAAILLFVLAMARPVAAQEAARQALLEQARAASTAGDHHGAVDAAVRARALGPNPSVHAFLAQEYVALTDYARALDSATACVQGATADATLTGRQRFIARCTTLRDQALAHVARLVIHTPQPVPTGLVIRVNQEELASALWDVGSFVNEGTTTVEATADGYESFSRHVPVTVPPIAEGATPTPSTLELTIELSLTTAAAVSDPTTLVTTEPTTGPTRTTTTHSLVHERPAQRIELFPAAIGVAVGAAVLLGVAVGLHVYAEDRVTTYNGCVLAGGSNCPEIRAQYDPGFAAAIAFDVLGAIALAGAITLFVLDLSQPAAGTASTATALRCGVQGAGLACRAEL